MHADTIFTIGHSNRGLDKFVQVLTAFQISTLVDIRSHPASKRFPHFSENLLRAGLEQARLIYHWAGRQLGGLRSSAQESVHTALQDSLRGFRAVFQLTNLAGQAPIAIMCAEGRPEDCHRQLIADYLLLNGHQVVHLINKAESREHLLSPQARRESASLIYDRNCSGELKLQ